MRCCRFTLGMGWAVLRTRYAEDALEVAVGKGVHQYVIVGAGFDSFALRQPAFARHVDVFEIDHPATQELKRQRLHECGVPLPRTLHFVPAEANRATLRAIAACSAPGSELVFTYVDQREFGGDRASVGAERVQVAFAAAREPWLSGFDPSLLAEDLTVVGLTLIEDLDGLGAKERYCSGRRDDLFPMTASHIVHAEVR